MKPYYDHDGITIYHGDCREVLPTLPAKMAVVSDPPYGIAYQKGKGGSRGSYRGPDADCNRHYGVIKGDDEPFDPAYFLRYPNVLLWGANHFCKRLPECGRWLAWNKLEHLESFDSFSDVEFAWHSIGKVSRIFSYMWKGGLACRKADANNNGRRDHPNQKPVALMTWCIKQANPADELDILDPFMGSGTTLRAAKDLGRKAIGIEIEERYCEIAAKRMEQGVFAFGDSP